MKFAVIGIVVILALAAYTPARADVIYLKDGKVHDGEVSKETKDSVTIRVIAGVEICELTIPKSDIKNIERKPSSVTEYLRLLSEIAPDNAFGLKILAGWCRENSLSDLAALHEEKARAAYKTNYLTSHPDQACACCNAAGAVNCGFCNGSGTVDAPCPKCEKKGYIPCPVCKGSNRIPCKNCKETGRVQSKKKKDETELCPKCNGFGYAECGKCENGRSPCPDCKGKRFVRKKCIECKGRGLIPCADCGGMGIAAAYKDAFERAFAALGSAKDPAPRRTTLEPPDADNANTPDNASAVEKERIYYANIYARDCAGQYTGDIFSAEVSLYNVPPVTGKEPVVEQVKDNEPLTLLEEAEKAMRVKTASGIIGWASKENIRPEKWTFRPCPACGGNGWIKCPVCESGRVKIGDETARCTVCDGSGKIVCRHCKGRGVLRKK